MADWEDVGAAWEDVAPQKKRGLGGKSAKDFLPTEGETEDYLAKLRGVAEAGANLISGGVTGTAGQIAGTLAGMMEYGFGKGAQPKVEQAAAKGMESGTYMPRTPYGQEFAGRAGEAMQEAIPLMAHLPMLEGATTAAKGAMTLRNAAKPPVVPKGFATEVPLTLEEALAQADKAPENNIAGPRRLAPDEGWQDVTPPQSKRAKLQGELPFEEQQPIAVTEKGTALTTPEQVTGYEQFGRDMEQPKVPVQEQTPLFADEAGTITKELPELPSRVMEDPEITAFAQAEAERKVREAQAKEAVENGQTGNLFADYVNQHRDYELFRDENGRPLSRAMFNETVKNLENEPTARYVRPEDMDAAYAKYLENFNGVQAGLFDQPTTALEMAKTLRNDAAQRLATSHPIVKAAERFVNEQEQFLAQLKEQGATAAAIKDAARDVEAATKRLEKTKENIINSISTGKKPKALPKNTLLYEGMGEMFKRGAQSSLGGKGQDFKDRILAQAIAKKFSPEALKNKTVELVTGENTRKYLPDAVDKRIGDYTMERRSAEEIANDIHMRNIPDMKSTPLSDKVQAGGVYKGLETNNPIVRKTFAAVKQASHNAAENIRTFIQAKDGLPALFRELNKKDAADWWAQRQMTEGTGEALNLTEKQKRLNDKFNETMDFVFDRVNETLALHGKDPIDKRMGYLAGQMTGDFRKAVYKKGENGEKIYIGAIGSNTRGALNRRASAIAEAHPEWEIGPERTSMKGRRENRQKAFEDVLDMIAEKNPDTKALVDAYDAILKNDAYNYMNAKKHTMTKKGTFGTEGFKHDVDAWTNAKEGMASQIRYVEKMLNWAEMSKAVEEVRPLLKDDTINMPNAKKWSSDYLDRALGIQTSEIGAALDGVINAVGKGMGVGPSAIEHGAGLVKNTISKTLLGFVNPMFLAINALQPAAVLPQMNSLLASRGIKGAHMGSLPSTMMSAIKVMNAKEMFGALTPFEKTIRAEGQKRGLFQSDIFEHTPHLTKSSQRLSRLSELGIPEVESATRGFVFTHFAKMLEKNGLKGRELFDIAENLTNQSMTDYSHYEAPSLYKEMGTLGDMAVTLQRYKHNNLSSLAMLAREAKNNKSFRPLGTALATAMAFSGLTGMLGFNEADKAYQLFTKAMGKPDTLTRLAMDELPDVVSFGAISALTGVDMSKRFGMQLFPDSPSGVLFPGASRLAEIPEAAYDLVKGAISGGDMSQPVAGAVRAVAPNSMRGAIDVAAYQDEGLAHNPNRDMEGTIQRTPFDTAVKAAGASSLSESKQKATLYQEQLVDKAYADQRKSITKQIFNDLYDIRKDPEAIYEYFNSGRGDELKRKFIESEGDVRALSKAVLDWHKGTDTTAETRKKLEMAAALQGEDVGRKMKAKRYAERLNRKE